MTGTQVFYVAMAFAVLIAITLAAQFKWLPRTRVITFLAGVAVIFFLYAAGLPPWWFAGEWEGFSLAISLLLGAWVMRTPEERAFGTPLLGAMGLTLVVLNAIQAARNVL